MGLFNRNGSGTGSQNGKPRPSVSSEAQAAELRGRARRRLAGAVALVVAAVIILPMVLDSEPVPVSDDIPIRIPERNGPYDPTLNSPSTSAANGGVAEAPTDQPGSVVPTPAPAAAPATTEPPRANNGASPAASGGAPVKPAAKPAEARAPEVRYTETRPLVKPDGSRPDGSRPEAQPVAPTSRPEPRVAVAPKPLPESRTDNGERALALLEGRNAAPAASAPKPKPPANNGNFVLQIAAYTVQPDAQSRRDKLHAAGVTNAFVEQTTVGGKQQYRLRVGPFPSRDAAQAAQARLRTLGYDNGFIAAQ